MQIRIRKKNEQKEGGMDRQDLQPRVSKPRESEDLKYIEDEKIPVMIREIVRIHPKDFSALKNSFEEWSKQWE